MVGSGTSYWFFAICGGTPWPKLPLHDGQCTGMVKHGFLTLTSDRVLQHPTIDGYGCSFRSETVASL